jgi:hypothetical protein
MEVFENKRVTGIKLSCLAFFQKTFFAKLAHRNGTLSGRSTLVLSQCTSQNFVPVVPLYQRTNANIVWRKECRQGPVNSPLKTDIRKRDTDVSPLDTIISWLSRAELSHVESYSIKKRVIGTGVNAKHILACRKSRCL